MDHWHVIQAKPTRERELAVILHQRGLEVYLPLMRARPTRRCRALERPYFLGCLFAKTDGQGPSLDVIRWTPGLKALVEFDGQLAAVSDRFVKELRQRLQHLRTTSGPAVEPNDDQKPSEIATGPFAGFEGLFNCRISSARRAHILLACVQREHWRSKADQSVKR